MALVFLLSWWTEPRCCDTYTSNTLLSFTPQLKYMNGPPPI
jgi:hypothetical protein